MVMSEYLRGVALKPKLKIIQGRQLDFEATDQLRRVGVLLNQIAKAMNAKQEALPSSRRQDVRGNTAILARGDKSPRCIPPWACQ